MFLPKDLDELLASEAEPAVSLYLPTHAAGREVRQDAIRLKNLTAEIAEQLRDGWRRGEIDALLAPAHALVEDEAFWRPRENGLAVFLAPGFSRVHTLPIEVAEEALVGPRFHVKPLLPLLEDSGPFWLLTISASRTRLYQGSRWSLTEVDAIRLPQGIGAVAGMTEYENTYYAAPTGRHNALAKAQSFGDAPNELRKTELIELLRRIAAAVEPHVAADQRPVILAALPELQGHFREIAPWPLLWPAGIAENPDAMRTDELHRRAYDVIAAKAAATRAQALDRLRALLGTGDGKATTRPDEIVKAASRSRIDTLFVSGDEHLWGNFDEAQDRVVVHGSATRGDVDLLDYAVVMTLRLGGHVALVEPSALPPATHAAAILRY
jgi:hypothetical protein